MKKYYISILTLCFLFVFNSCKLDDELNIDKKNPSTVPGNGLFTNGARNIFDLMNSCSVNSNVFRLYSQYWAQTTYPDESQYNQVSRNIGGSIWSILYKDGLADLKSAGEFLKEESASDLSNKLAVINIMEVYAYSVLVDTFGDIPYTEALDINNLTPAYDDASAVYDAIIEKLDGAIASISTQNPGFGVDQDPVYQGDMTKWKKAANSLKLRLAMRLATKNPTLSKTMAEEAFMSGVILNDQDNFGIKYLSSAPNTNPLWVSLVQSGRADFTSSNTMVDKMNMLDDPRLASYFKMYNGAYVGGTYGSANSATTTSGLSDILKQPDLVGNLITATEVNFLLAEAAARTYSVGGTVSDYYDAGITSSILEWGGEQADADTYLANTDVAYATANGTWEEKVATQKWLAMFNNGFEGWTTWRIFNYPVLNVPEGLTASDIPNRFLYPTSEATRNATNYNSAASAIGGDKKSTTIFWE